MTVIDLAIVLITPIETDSALFNRLLADVPADRRDYILRFKQTADRCRSLAATAALDTLLRRRKGLSINDCVVMRGLNGKPYLRDYPDAHFNLSHSGQYAVAAMAGVPVGVDVEKTARFREDVARYFLPQDEIGKLKQIAVENERDREFTRLWTRWEARQKLTGKGLAAARRDYLTSDGDQPAVFRYENWIDDGHHLSLACDIAEKSCRVAIEKVIFAPPKR